MFIIKSFGINDFSGWNSNLITQENLLHEKYLYNKSEENVTIASPVIDPKLLVEYLALNVIPLDPSLRVAFFCPSENTYKMFDGSRWVDSSVAVDYEIIGIQDLVTNWFKDLRLFFTLPPRSTFAGIKIAFEAAIALEDYLLEFALPLYLKTVCRFSYVARSEIIEVNRSQIPFNIYFSREKIENVTARVLGGDTSYNISLSEGHIIIPEAIEEPFLVTFEALPKIDFVSGSYQIAEIPSVIIRKSGEEEIRKNPSRYDAVLTDGVSRNKVSKDILALTYNLVIDIIFVAPNLKLAQMMYESILSNTHEKPIYLAPIDENLGFIWNTAYKLRESNTLGTEIGTENFSILTVTGKVLNVPVSIRG